MADMDPCCGCANCEAPTIENHHFELDQENGQDEIPEVVTVAEAITLIFANQKYASCCKSTTVTVGLCPNCLPVLAELYRLYRRFKDQSTESSYIHRFLSDSNMEFHNVNSINKQNDDLLAIGKYEEEEMVEIGCDVESILCNLSEDDEDSDRELSIETQTQVSPRPRVGRPRITPLEHGKKGKSKRKAPSTPIRQSSTKKTRSNSASPHGISEVVPGPSSLIPSAVDLKPENPVDEESESKRPFVCIKCDPPKRFTRPKFLTVHERAYHPTDDGSQRKFKCQECSIQFRGERGLRKHMKGQHQELLKFECEICLKTFSGIYYLNEHQKSAHGNFSSEQDKNYSCIVCGKVYPENFRLVAHQKKIHTIGEGLQCGQCEKIFFSQVSFEYHVNIIHPEEHQAFPGRFDCNLCEKSYCTKGGLQTHVDSVHLKKKEYVCDVCGYKTPTQFYLRRHLETHDPNRERNHQCPTCEKLFATRAAVRMHRISHLPNGLNCICQYCGKSFAKPASLKRHLEARHRDIPEVAAKIKSYPCPICGKDFKLQEYLTQHLRSKAHGGTGRHQNKRASRKTQSEEGTQCVTNYGGQWPGPAETHNVN